MFYFTLSADALLTSLHERFPFLALKINFDLFFDIIVYRRSKIHRTWPLKTEVEPPLVSGSSSRRIRFDLEAHRKVRVSSISWEMNSQGAKNGLSCGSTRLMFLKSAWCCSGTVNPPSILPFPPLVVFEALH